MGTRTRRLPRDFWDDPEYVDLSFEAHSLLAVVITDACDDEGYFYADPQYFREKHLPKKKLQQPIETHFQLFKDCGFVRLFKGTNGKPYGIFPKFKEQQKVYHPTPSRIFQLDPEFVAARAAAVAASAALPPAPPKPEVPRKTVSIGPTEQDCIEVLNCYAYPRIKPTQARKAIRAAFMRLMKDGRTFEEAKAYLLIKTARFALSDRGRDGRYTPHAVNWFNNEGYGDPEESWSKPKEKKPRESYKDRQRNRPVEPGVNPQQPNVTEEEAQAAAVAYWTKQRNNAIYKDCPAQIKRIIEGTPPKAAGAR
jgi:hypothetical protein